MKDKLFESVRDCCKFDHCLGKTDLNICKNQCTDAQVRVDIMLSKNVVVLPVKPGDTVYNIHRGKIKEWTVYFVGMNSLGEFTFNIADKDFKNSRSVWDREIGETVFLTEEDAINELKERKSYEREISY